MSLTQKDVRAAFKTEWNEATKTNPRLAADKPAKSEAFGQFLDALHRAGDITQKQYENITMEPSKVRTTEDEHCVDQYLGGAWEEVCSEATAREARARVKDYQQNQPSIPVRYVKRRVKK
jgi:hypothetical protein